MAPKLYWIDFPAKGKIAISARPRGGDWLEDEVRGWREAGVDVVVSLLTQEEERDLDIEKEGPFSETHGIQFLSLPIPDRGIPRSTAAVEGLVEKVRDRLAHGHTVAIHCRQGIGRSGMIAAAVLIAEGVSPGDAVGRVTQARGLPVPETSAQLVWLDSLSKPATQQTRSLR